ncbi:MAG: DUF456 family protein [Candidatus Aminicenantes bacterium]|nr:DUF456 family protein [Candidatus Aminicenantes bacterium]
MIVLIIIGFIFIIVGLIGCIVPGVPGPPFSFLALVLMSVAKGWEPFSLNFLIIMALITIVVTALDYVVPAAGAKKFGASRYGFWGAVIGMLVGIIFFPPLGMIIGAFLGAIIGEMVVGKTSPEALKAGWGVFVGIMFGMIIKLIASGVMTFYFIKALF